MTPKSKRGGSDNVTLGFNIVELIVFDWDHFMISCATFQIHGLMIEVSQTMSDTHDVFNCDKTFASTKN